MAGQIDVALGLSEFKGSEKTRERLRLRQRKRRNGELPKQKNIVNEQGEVWCYELKKFCHISDMVKDTTYALGVGNLSREGCRVRAKRKTDKNRFLYSLKRKSRVGSGGLGLTGKAKEDWLRMALVELEPLLSSPCPICGKSFEYGERSNGLSPSIDQIVAGAGYVSGNMQLLHYRCNVRKNDHTLESARQLHQYFVNIEGAKNRGKAQHHEFTKECLAC